ncbi:MAG: AMP-binding enzyme, partial [Burkholderiales bacterium]
QALAEDLELYKTRFPNHCLLYTGMGATETGHIREYFIDKKSECIDGVVPTGYAIEDKEVLLLDEDRRPVAQGEVGEIAVRSAYLAIGYWNKPELTEAVFLPDPDGGNRRIYLTGDLGKMLPDGCLMHQGRKDFQVKIRGFRVEIGEIERNLREHPDVAEAAVVAADDPQGEKTLVAYIVARQRALSSADLRDFLKSKVPDYM